MKVELLYFDGCPGYEKAEQALRAALSGEGSRGGFEMVGVNTDEEAEKLRLRGSPTSRVNGWDLFPTEGLGSEPRWRLAS